MCDNAFDIIDPVIMENMRKALLEYEASRERFKQKRKQMGLRIEETEFELIRPHKNKSIQNKQPHIKDEWPESTSRNKSRRKSLSQLEKSYLNHIVINE